MTANDAAAPKPDAEADLALPPSAAGPVKPYRRLGIAFVLTWLVGLYLLLPGARQPLEDATVSVPADYDWTLEDLEGRPVSFTKFKGKTVFLNIWATWCPPCVSEMPTITALAKRSRLQGKDIVFLCVSVDQTTEKVRSYVADKNWPMTVLRTTSLPPVFQSDGIPATYILSPQGDVVAAEIGAVDWDNSRAIELLAKLATPKP